MDLRGLKSWLRATFCPHITQLSPKARPCACTSWGQSIYLAPQIRRMGALEMYGRNSFQILKLSRNLTSNFDILRSIATLGFDRLQFRAFVARGS